MWPEEERNVVEEGADALDFSHSGTMVRSRVDTKPTCGGAMQ